ncbi:MAG TPA: response regulator transcription factor, partial [Patescibacteria group bacterium]|nr:response regulator transcription factor [Patescibacteria group bacterium]
MENNILLVEDDANLGTVLQDYLELRGYETTLCRDGEAGLQAYQQKPHKLCIFDVMMPKKDGFSLAREIRKTDQKTPILFLTAKSMKEDKIEGFKAGADDYVTKPFSIEELLLRVEAILRRCETTSAQVKPTDEEHFHIGKYSFDAGQRKLSINEEVRILTSKEAELLKVLCENTNAVVKRSDALMKVWGNDSYFNGRSMDVFITKLRKYLKDDPTVEIINVHGMGYRLN